MPAVLIFSGVYFVSFAGRRMKEEIEEDVVVTKR
jgi:hypothetical protein